MLPFLAKKLPASPGVIIKNRAPDEPDESEDDSSAAHEACGHAMLAAIKAGDAKALAEAALDLFSLGDSEPHAEGPHTYDAQNEKAAKEE